MKDSSTFSIDSLLDVSTKKREACVLAGPFLNMLDHTIPIASILDIPLITKDPSIIFTFKKFYPPFKCQFKDWTIPYILENFSTIFYGFNIKKNGTETWSFKRLIQEHRELDPHNSLYDLPVKFIYHFHGCSDKRWFEKNSHLEEVDQILFYGDHMIDLFKSLELYERVVSSAIVGNYRKAYYLKHQTFFDDLVEKEIFSKFKKKQFTILYAPTWQDRTSATSIFKAYSHVLDQLPSHYNLVLKLHPTLSCQIADYDPKMLYDLLDPYARAPNIQIVPMLPCIYPILNKVDLYLGDHSSVGYDALSFNLPLFFINHDNRPKEDPTTHLFKAGRVLHNQDLPNFYKILDQELPDDFSKYSEIRNKLYNYAFGKDLSYEKMKERFKNFLI